MAKLTPKQRVIKAMERVSRDRYLLPSEVRALTWRFSCLASAVPHTIECHLNNEAYSVGMFKGKPLLLIGEYNRKFVEGIEKIEKARKKPFFVEAEILFLLCEMRRCL